MSLKSSLKRPQPSTKAPQKPPKMLLKKQPLLSKKPRPISITPRSKATATSLFLKKPIAKKQKPQKKTLNLRRGGQVLRK